MIIVYCQLIEINIPVPKFTPAVLSLCCISPCSCLLFLFCCCCFIIQFESTRSSSPTECCRISPWSRKVVVPRSALLPSVCSLSLVLATPHLFLFVWLLLIYITNLFSNACLLPGALLWHPALVCLLWNWRTNLRFQPHWPIIYLHTQTVVCCVLRVCCNVRNVWGLQSARQGFSNDRVHVWKFAITHDSSLLWFPRCNCPGESCHPCVSLFSTKYIKPDGC